MIEYRESLILNHGADVLEGIIDRFDNNDMFTVAMIISKECA